ncbi:DUF6247 family protein [Streptomyces purpureus]|uniref:Uncharacterized protein n=1 Tax=Streptomyces purpureus TaxID=1951 RepID=A0A918HK71_9ACTN|nr:DUF6247 family protein [Streptomyces purpureus]GGT67151.1 hypothetical protein GCM10014713_69560 [Streptomyces purpureus]
MTAQPLHFDGPGGDRPRRVPPMPERTPQALRLAIQEHAPHLLPDFEAHWRRAIGEAFNLTPVPAFMRLWWTEYAIARDPGLADHLRDLEARAATSEDPAESARLLDEYSRLRHEAAHAEPGR